MICRTCFGAQSSCETCKGLGHLPGPPARPIAIDPRNFATQDSPIHASAIPELIKCPWRLVMLYLFPEDPTSSEAADTGSATHVAVAHWHKNKDTVAAVRAMRKAIDERFRLADATDAAGLFLNYTRDPRNIEANVIHVEYKVQIAITPSIEDTTHQAIHVVGTLDQIREIDGRFYVWDLKTSKRPGWDQLGMYLYQQALYAIAASHTLNTHVRLGGLITPRHYKIKQPPETAPEGIYWHYPQLLDDLEPILDGLRNVVASVRRGDVYASPGEQCRYCAAQGPDRCIPLLKESLDPHTRRITINVVRS